MAVSCLSATGMSLDDMRTYMANAQLGAAAAADQQALLQQQARHLAVEAERLVLRRRYLDLKVAYWQAVIDGDTAAARAGRRPGTRARRRAPRHRHP